ncbi:MAG: signal peptidase I [Alysiella sp.]|uniref:signal peptidase I n=1 Tax=Alysiella sp. TaxID=1872483 RepID=UPI0026DC8A1A|nr:signal peptidase I [Alysiella sp.]MDO4433600.1 signal peptidase I [Alysiella sp.]
MALAALCVGAIMLFSGSKQRNEAGEWGSGVQWGYLLIMVGIFGVLSGGLKWSFTAILLLFTAITGLLWLWKKCLHKNEQLDNNHFRDYMAGFFPIIAVIFVLRTFVAEPFQIPSSSMRPGLVKGDFILVNKFAYGIRVPVLNSVAIPTGKIERGDVVVFNYPLRPELNYIKRIVGVSGDVIEYKDKILMVNGEVQTETPVGSYTYPDDNNPQQEWVAERFQAALNGKQFDVLKKVDRPSFEPRFINEYSYYNNGLKEHCTYFDEGSAFKCTVPEGKYFAMGDNRDSSADSRYWGFVDDRLIVGKAFFVWLNLNELGRIGTNIQ